MSTEEELHQVLNVLGESRGRDWMIPLEASETPQASDLWTDGLLDDSVDADVLAKLAEKRPKFKN